ncbi:MAG: hypothetical protein HY717_20685 [Planctomycetes bacterium]|nr:hypothetical protein [Planctomycetota bacterium]
MSVREVQFAIRNTDQEIHGDLKSLKAGFPQLAGIEKAKVGLSRDAKTARFLYEKGRLSEPKAPAGPRFEKDGCGVFIVATVKP